jgi:hypothetical protein
VLRLLLERSIQDPMHWQRPNYFIPDSGPAGPAVTVLWLISRVAVLQKLQPFNPYSRICSRTILYGATRILIIDIVSIVSRFCNPSEPALPTYATTIVRIIPLPYCCSRLGMHVESSIRRPGTLTPGDSCLLLPQSPSALHIPTSSPKCALSYSSA